MLQRSPLFTCHRKPAIGDRKIVAVADAKIRSYVVEKATMEIDNQGLLPHTLFKQSFFPILNRLRIGGKGH
jgi:hypothetical protein